MKAALTRYRVMAWTVGVLLIVLCLVGVPLSNFDGTEMWGFIPSTPNWFDEGSRADELGEFITGWLGTLHGWLYMIFLIFAFSLARKARWDMPFTVVTLLMGTVPVLSFWSEHRATRKVRADFADELDPTTTPAVG